MVNGECEKRRPLSVVICPLFLLHRLLPVACRFRQLTKGEGQRTKDSGRRTKDKGRLSHSAFTLHTYTSYFIYICNRVQETRRARGPQPVPWLLPGRAGFPDTQHLVGAD